METTVTTPTRDVATPARVAKVGGRPPLGLSWRILALTAWLAASAWLVPKGVALWLDKQAPTAALRWWPADPEARVRTLDIATGGFDAQRIADWSRLRPLDGRALRQLAELAEERGEVQRARALYTEAARWTPRDRHARAWLVDDAWLRGDDAAVVEHATALIGMDISLRQPAMRRLAELAAARPGVRDALARVLAAGPEWRREFIARWQDSAAGIDAMDTLLQEVIVHGARLEGRERSAWVEALKRAGRMQAAQLAGRRSRQITDGDFPLVEDPVFGWTLLPEDGTDMRRARSDDGRTALRIGFSGQPRGFGTVGQSLALAPGPHRLLFNVRLDDVVNPAGLQWSLSCMDDRPLGHSAALSGRSDWHGQAFEATVPPDCLRQRLWLHAANESPGFRRFEGVAWLTGLRVASDVSAKTIPTTPTGWQRWQWPGCTRVVEAGLLQGNPCLDDRGQPIATAPTRHEPVAGFMALLQRWDRTARNEMNTREPDLPLGP